MKKAGLFILLAIIVALFCLRFSLAPSGIKKTDFDRVTVGMNMQGVGNILGRTRDTGQADGVHYTVIDDWNYREAGSPNKKATITFTNGRVTDKQWQ
jgi:hypothetical protein